MISIYTQVIDTQSETYFESTNGLEQSKELIFNELTRFQLARSGGEMLRNVRSFPAADRRKLLCFLCKPRGCIDRTAICFVGDYLDSLRT